MKTPTPVKKPAKKYGPGKYKRVEDLPKATVSKENRNETHRPCPSCRQPARREYVYHRQLHDVGDLVSGRPVELPIISSQHHCQKCNRYFMTDLSDRWN